MSCFIPNVLNAAGCCAEVYEPTQTDEVRKCLYAALLQAKRTAINDWSALEEFGKGQETPFRKAIDLQVIQEYFMDQWNKLVTGMTVQEVWDAGCFPTLLRFFRCRYNLDLTAALATVGIYDPAKPVPGANAPVLGLAFVPLPAPEIGDFNSDFSVDFNLLNP